MNTTAGLRSQQPGVARPLRLWPGVVLAALIVLLRFVVPVFVRDLAIAGVLAAAVGAALVLAWWLFFSRAPWSERLGAPVVIIAAVFATRPLLDKSIATGLMGMMFYFYAAPSVVAPAFVAWAVLSRRFGPPVRWATMVATVFLACASWTLMRTDGITGDAGAQLAWRWTKTAEERLLAQGEPELTRMAPAAAAATGPVESGPARAPAGDVASEPRPAPGANQAPLAPSAAKPADAGGAASDGTRAAAARSDGTITRAEGPALSERAVTRVERVEWAGFRGAARDGVVRNVRLETDWTAKPPVQMWHRAIGPGWSSFAVQGDLLYTQEQRGEEEIVAAYHVSSGAPVWRHRDRVRFWESNGGAGPRGTPTLANGRVYAFGATGILNVLDAQTGAVVWTRNVGTDAAKKIPMWGFTSSPLITGDLVVVAAGGKLAAYDLATGKPRWFGPNGGGGYSSPQLTTVGGVEQIVFLSGAGATGINPSDGKPLWEYAWPGTPIVQPGVTAEGDILVTSGDGMGGMGMRRLAIAHGAGAWTVEERWTTNGLKPYFNDFVVHNGHAFGFDGRILSCIDLKDGTRAWKGGRFGQGQLVLLPNQDLLLVISEEGELALVSATPDKFIEIARFQAIEGKTWNHPVLIRDTLLVRNDQEMAAFRLVLAGR